MLIGGLLAAWQLRPQSDSQLPTYASIQFPDAWAKVAESLFYFPYNELNLFGEVSRVLAPLSILAVLIALIDRPKLLFIGCCGLGWLAYLFHFKWFQAPRHSGIVLLLLVTMLWLAFTLARSSAASNALGGLASIARRGATALLTIGLLISAYHAFRWIAGDWTRPFSDAPEMARWIRANVDQRETIVGDMFCGTVSAHLGSGWHFWLAARREFGTFHTWTGEAFRQNTLLRGDPTLITTRAQAAFGDQPYLILSSFRITDRPDAHFELLHSTPGRRIGYYDEAEQYFLYRRVVDDHVDGEAGPRASSPAEPRRASTPVPSSYR
jgi:hypothetical protein